MNEEWMQYKNTDRYVSNTGKVKSTNGTLKPFRNTSGYLQVWVKQVGINKKKLFVHRMVAECWVPNPEHYKFIHHIDENPNNNNANNLKWVSTRNHQEEKSKLRRCINRKRRKKDIAQIDPMTGDIIHIWNRELLRKQTEFHFPYILRCCNSRGGCHHGYGWRYCERNIQLPIFKK